MMSVVLSAALLAGAPAPVQGQLALAVHAGEQAAGRTLATRTLTCAVGDGGHCRDLSKAGGDIGRIPDRGGICSMIYAPVTVTATGAWEGRPIAFSHTYGNRCVAKGAVGGLFDF